MKFRNWMKDLWAAIVADHVTVTPLTEYEVARMLRDKRHPQLPWIELDSRKRTLKCGIFDQNVMKRIRFNLEVQHDDATYSLPIEIVLQYSFTGSGGAFILGESCIYLQTEDPECFPTPVQLPWPVAEYTLRAAYLHCIQAGILIERIPLARSQLGT